MKRSSRRALCLSLMCLFVLALPAFAKGRKNLTIYEKSRLNDTLLEPGQYKVEIAENGGTAELSIYKGKDLIAKSAAQSEKLERKADRNALRFSLEGGNVPKIIEIRLSGERQAYRISGGEASQVSRTVQ